MLVHPGILERLTVLASVVVLACGNSTTVTEHWLDRASAQDLDTLASLDPTDSAYRLVNGFAFDAHLDSARRTLPDSRR